MAESIGGIGRKKKKRENNIEKANASKFATGGSGLCAGEKRP